MLLLMTWASCGLMGASRKLRKLVTAGPHGKKSSVT